MHGNEVLLPDEMVIRTDANEWFKVRQNLGYDSCPYLNNFTGWHEWL